MKRTFLTAIVAFAFGAVACSSSPSVSPVTPTSVADLSIDADPTTVPSQTSLGRSSLQTITGIAASNADFSTLVAALAKAGLVDFFDGDRHFTVFAPTNDAFDDAAAAFGYTDGPALIAALDVSTLTSILTYHVTRGDRNSTSVVAAGSVRMLDGNVAMITTDGGAKIDNANILATDIRASNGLIHVIDAVLLPPSLR